MTFGPAALMVGMALWVVAPAALPEADPPGSPIAPVFQEPEPYSETYSFVFVGGPVVVKVYIAISNLGVGDENASCRAVVLGLGEDWSAMRWVHQGEWSYRPGPPAQLAVSGCRLTADGDTRLRVELEGKELALVVAAPVRSLRAPGHRVEVEDRFFESQIFFAWASARLSIRGWGDRDPQPIQGRVAGGHFRVTAWPDDLAREWVRLYGLGEEVEEQFLGYIRFHPEGAPAPGMDGWLWSAPRHAAGELTGAHWLPGGQLQMNTDQGQARVRIETEIFRYAPLEELGLLGYIAARFLGNPVTRTYRVRFKGADNKTRQGLLEVTRDE